MRCSHCNYPETRVVDSRDASDDSIRRRRECQHCGSRFTTYEHIQSSVLMVVKHDGRLEEFNRDKLGLSLRLACAKRALPIGTVDKIVNDIGAQVQNLGKIEVPSKVIGEMVMDRLESLDRVAYIRFASVYRDFQDLDTFRQEVETLLNSHETTAHDNPESNPQLTLLPMEMSSQPRKRRSGGHRRMTPTIRKVTRHEP